MPAAISLDLRKRAIKALENGQSFDEVAERFEVSSATVRRWKALYDETGSLETRPRVGNRAKRKLTDELRQVVIAWIEQEPDLILPCVAQRLLEQYDVSITPSQISRTLIALGYTRKKTHRSTRAERGQTSKASDLPG
jgi:transposase